jgi:hypothetical protein
MPAHKADLLTELTARLNASQQAIEDMRREFEERIEPLKDDVAQCEAAIRAVKAMRPIDTPKPGAYQTSSNDFGLPTPKAKPTTRDLILEEFATTSASTLTKDDLMLQFAHKGYADIKPTTVGSLLSVMARDGVLVKRGLRAYGLKRVGEQPMPAGAGGVDDFFRASDDTLTKEAEDEEL